MFRGLLAVRYYSLMPNIPGLRSCYDKVGRLIYFGRMLDKIRFTPPVSFHRIT